MWFSYTSERSALRVSASTGYIMYLKGQIYFSTWFYLLFFYFFFFHSFLLWYFAGVARRFTSVGKYRLDFTMCYLAVSPCSTLTARLCLQTANRSSTTWTCWFKSTQSATPLSLFPLTLLIAFSLAPPGLQHDCQESYSCEPMLSSHTADANVRRSICVLHSRFSCVIPLCQCGAETKYQQQDTGEQIRHKVNAFHLDSWLHAMLGLQSSADVKSSAALLIYEANPVSTCAYENYGSAKVQDRKKKKKKSGGIIPLEKFLYLE